MRSPSGIDKRLFPESDEDAQERYTKWKNNDPFPDIAPALLNTADLLDYVSMTGMIHPLPVDDMDDPPDFLKPASIGIRLSGAHVWWEEDFRDPDQPIRRSGSTQADETFVIKHNSIVYMTLEPVLRLPHYIAARFNLNIRDIYRGILVGTGPLVDPGFQGQLHLPLHNLTASDYELNLTETIVWVEFTKLSPNEEWSVGSKEQRPGGVFVPFPGEKLRRRTIDDYLKVATNGRPVRSSIPTFVARAQNDASNARKAAEDSRDSATSAQAASESAKKKAEQLSRRFTQISVASAVVLGIAVVALVFQMVGLINDVRNVSEASVRELGELRLRVDQQEEMIRDLERRLQRLDERRP